MKTYYDLQAIDPLLIIGMKFETIGTPNYTVNIGNDSWHRPDQLECKTVDIQSCFDISVSLQNKTYTTEYETAVIIKSLTVDGIELTPYNYLAQYINDHNYTNPTTYLGFNGKWTLTFERPFYQWLHQVQAQGWLLT